MNKSLSLKVMKRGLLLMAALLISGATAMAQDFYVIKAGDNFLAHTNTTTIGNAATFNAETCLWTISGSNIIAIAPDGTTGYYLSYRSGNNYTLNLRSDATYIDWTSGISNGGEPYYSTGGNRPTYYYLRYRNSAWGVSNNSTHGVLTKVTFSDVPNTSGSSSTSYSASISGDGIIYSTPGTHTYTAAVNQITTYAQTLRTFSGYGTGGTPTATITRPYPVSSAYSGTLTNVNWSVNSTTYGTIDASTGVLTITDLPTSQNYDNITVTYTATAGGETVTTTKSVMIFKNQDTYLELLNGGTQGVNTTTGVVTLNDYEDHSWAYYSDASCPIHSLNPADVKITYYGNGTNNISTTNGATPASSSWTQSASTVKVGPNDDYNTFVYYKTMERLDGSTSNNPTGLCEYTTIPNPFSVRPTYQYATGDLNKYCGFYMWRIKDIKNGKIYDANDSQKTKWTSGNNVTTTNLLYAEGTYYFQPDNEYGMEVELEAMWARAYVTTGSGSMTTYTDSYERNFHVVTSTGQTASNYQKSYPVTISSLYPDGTNGGGSFTAGNFTAAADTKIENLNIGTSNNYTWTAAGHDFIIGRGCSGTVNLLTGINDNITNPNYRIRVESARFNYVSLLNGYYTYDDNSTSGNSITGTLDAQITIGTDYDRAVDDTEGPILYYNFCCGMGNGRSINTSNNMIAHVKSGQIGSYWTISNSSSYTASAEACLYMGITGNTGWTTGHRQLFVEGGTIASIAGGIDGGDQSGTKSFSLRMSGGKVRGAVYGGGARSAAYGNRTFIFTGGNVVGWIGGGCNGEAGSGTTYVGTTNGESFIYFGGNAISGGTGSNADINGSTGGIVFGAGKGVSSSTSIGQMAEGTNIVVADNCDIEHNVYGGGNYGYAADHSSIYILGGTVHGNVFGGSNQNNGPVVNVTMKGGTVEGDIYGGSNQSGNITGAVNVKVYGGTVNGAVYGCNNAGGAPQSTVNVDIYGTDPAPSADAYALGKVFGGGNQAAYNGTPVVKVHNCDNSIEYVYGGGNAATVRGTDVTIYGGNKIGNVFGGCYGANVTNSGTNVKIYGGTIGKVFGGSNSSGTITGAINVTINKQADTDPEGSSTACDMKIGEVYSGGNVAGSAAGTINIQCTGDLTDDHSEHPENIGTTLEGIGYVYGGANQAAISSDITVNINSGIVANVFGGNNTSGTISGGITVNIEKNNSATCASNWYVGNVFGGGNLAPYTIPANKALAVNVKNGTVSGNVYGGGKGNSAVVTGSPVVTIGDNTSSHCAIVLENVYGGGDAAAITGNSSVTYNDNNASSQVGKLFGGGNAASVSGTSTVTLTSGNVTSGVYGGCNADGSVGAVTIALNGGQVGATGAGNSANVYGGGFGSATTTTGNIGVTLNGTTVYGDLYGGSALGSVNASTSNTTTLTISSNTLHGTIYGGGQGDVAGEEGHSNVTAISNGNVLINYNTANTALTGLYGGANVNGNVKGNITLNVLANVGAAASGTEGEPGYVAENRINVFGGGLGHATGTEGNVTVNMGTADGTKAPTVYGDIYGGSALGNVNNAAADLTTVNILNGTVHGNVYGGGLGDATVLANGYLDPTASTVEAIVNGTVRVNIGDASNNSSTPTIDGKVFGCNNLAGTPKGHVYVDVYRTAHTTANTYPSPEPANAGAITTPAATEFAIQEVYGGGNLAHYTTNLNGASTHVRIHNCDNTIQYVYGGGNAANTPANEVTIDGGRFEYVFGGGNGAGEGNPGANVAGDATVNVDGGIINYVFGGSNTLGVVNGTSSMTFATTPTCTRMVKELYGGGNMAPGGTVDMTIPCGVDGLNVVFGGSRNADIGTEALFNGGTKKNVTITIEGGTLAQVFGGNNQGGTIWGDVTLNLKGGIIGDAFGGNNAGGNVKGVITVNVEDAESNTCPLALTNVFGGGKDAAYTPAVATISGPLVNIKHKKSGTSITGSVFGGGQGSTATVTANPVVTVGDLTDGHSSYIATIDGDVYGGGDAADVVGTTTVLIQKCNTVISGDVYGGGNAANIAKNGDEGGSTSVTVTGGTINGTGHGMVFGGGHGNKNANPQTEANVAGNVTVTVNGGTINKVFGGSNSKGNIGGTVSVNVDKTASACEMHITEVYGGGNEAPGNAGSITIGCTGTEANGEGIGDVYGGANAANINSDITLNINGGRINNVFGGNNTSGTISGAIEVNIEKTQNCDWYVGNVYGGGNLAPYTGSPAVNVKNGTVSLNVYGGGKGAGAVVTGNPVVMVGDLTPAYSAYVAAVTGDVYGGGDAAAVTGTTSVTLQKANSTAGRLFGGGNAAGVSSTATVTLTAGTVSTGVYGGCNASGSVGDVTITLTNGQVGTDANHTADVYGGGFGSATTTTGNIGVSLGSTTVYGDLYGGSALGSVNASTSDNTTLTIGGANLHGTIYGGGKGDNSTTATTLGNVIINYNTANTNLTGLYGGANVNGDVAGDIAVNVEANVGASGAGNSVDIFGGGLGAATTTGGNVTVTVGNSSTPTIYGDIYGGSGYGEVGATGKLAKVDFKAGTLNGTLFGGGMGQSSPSAVSATVSGGTEVDVTDGTVSGGIYGGCNERGTVVEDITVNVTGGTIGADGASASVFGGGYGNNTSTSGNVEVNINGASVVVWGDVYGGSGFGDVNGGSSNTTTVNILNGTVKNDVFGGGLGSTSPAYAAAVNGAVTVNIGSGTPSNSATGGATGVSGNATIGGNVYGCNNTNGSPQQNVTVNIFKTAHTNSPVDNTYETGSAYAIANVFGGGKNADFSVNGKTATVNVYTCENTIGRVFGGGDAAAVYGSVVIIQGGRFKWVFGGGNGEVVNTQADIGNGGITLNLHGGKINTLVSASNQRGTVSGPISVTVDNDSKCDEEVTDFFGGSNMVAIGTNETPVDVTTTIDCGAGTFHNVYGGSNAANIIGNVTLNIKGGTIDNVFGGSKGVREEGTVGDPGYVAPNPANITGDVKLNLYGGTMVNAFGGSDKNGNITGNITVNMLDQGGTCALHVNNIYGGGRDAAYTPTSPKHAEVNLIHGTVSTYVEGGVTKGGNVFGGGYGATATVTSSPVVYVGYDATMATRLSYLEGIGTLGTTTVAVQNNVYGGGELANVAGSPTITIQHANTTVSGDVYGGGALANTAGSTVTVNGGTVTHDVYGGGLGDGSHAAAVTGAVQVTVNGGTVRDVFGCNNVNGAPTSTVRVDINSNVGRNVYGGGNAAPASVSPAVYINKGIVAGNVYGGGLGSTATLTGAPSVTVGDLTVGNESYVAQVNGDVYGGGDAAGVTGTTAVLIQKCNTVVSGNVYGGGNAADVNGTDVNIDGGTITGMVFGGGHGDKTASPQKEANVNGNVAVDITGGTINKVFGGSNSKGNITGTVAVNIEKDANSCEMHITEVYGGGNQAAGNAGAINIVCTGGANEGIGDVYGGAREADINSDITLNIAGGKIANVFGGNNVSGNINGGIEVNINWNGSCGQNSIQNVYGAGNLAQYTIPNNKALEVNILNGTVSQNVYGGGKGLDSDHSKGQVTGNPVVTIGDASRLNNNGIVAAVTGDVYGGGDAGNVVGTPQVNVINKCNTTIGNVYGGGNAADVNGTDVNIDGGNITGMVFGGGHGDKEASPQKEANVNGNVAVDVTGGTVNKVFGGSNSKGNISGTVAVNIDKGVNSCAMRINEVYGGGNEAAGNAGSITIGCTGTEANGEGIGDVYGGANAANINSDITLNINGGRINNVFGGNNTSGTISGAIEVNIEKTQNCDWYVGNVYGGGNLAPYTGSPAVNVKNGTVSLNVYGGGKGAGAVVTGDPVVMVGDLTPAHSAYVAAVTGDVYGGGDAAAVTGTTSVTLQKANSTAGRLFGGGNAAGVSSTATVTLTAGTVSTGVYGGCNAEGTVGGDITVALNGGTVGIDGTTTDVVYGGGYGHNTATGGDVNVTLNGATVYGSLYGGSALGSVNGSTSNTTTVTLSTNGLNGSVFGGGMGSGTTGSTQATTLGNTVVNINIYSPNLTGIYGGANVNGDVAGDINVNVEANVGTDASHTLSVYGGGFGQYTTTGGKVTVTVGNNSSTPTIYGDLYGGSALGEVGASGKIAKVDFKAGTLNGSIYGGGMGDNSTAAAVSGGTEVAVAAGTITKSIYGGCNVNGSVTEDITVNVTGGTLGASGNGNEASVYGGGFGHSTSTAGNVEVNINGAQATIWGDVYGGSGFGNVNSDNNDATTVNILNGTVKGNVFGGGLGDKASLGTGHYDYAATEYGTVTVNIGATDGASTPTYSGSATIGGKVYGCNNTNGSPRENVVVNIYQTAHTTSPVDNTYETGDAYAIADVFGGGKNADFSVSGKTATVNVYTCANTIGRVFGGGDAAAVYGSVVNIYGGRFNYVFGGGNGEVVNTQADVGAGGITLNLHGGNIGTLVSGSNQRGTISGPIQVQVDNNSPCSEEVTDFFGGSNQVDIATDVTTTIDCGAGVFRNVYGGSNAANISGNVTLNIKGGTMENVFGGSKGVLNGTAANILDDGTGTKGNVTLNLYGGTIGNAFGGSNYNGSIAGNITVNVLDHEGTCKLDITNIYGAGNLTAYAPTSSGKRAVNPVINVMHIKLVDDDPATNDDESVPGIRGSVYGAGKGDPSDDSQEPGMVTAHPQVNIGYNAATMATLPSVEYPAGISRDSYTAVICGNLIGGGDAAKVVGNPVVTVYQGAVKERIIGGGNAADVTGNTHVIVYDGTFGTGTVAGTSRGVYGGCNTTGTVSGNVEVDILGGTFGTQAAINITDSYNIHGGGFGAATRVNGNVTVNYGVDNGTANVYPKLYGDIYGGSALGHVNTENGSNTTTVNVLNGSFGYYEEMLGGEIVNGERVSGYLNQHGGNVYGGGLGQVAAPAADEIQDDPDTPENEYRPAHPALSDIAAKVYGVVTVNIGAVTPSNDTMGNVTLARCNVYGCNNANGSPQKDVYVNIYRTGHTTQNEADYIPGLDDKVTQLFAIRNVYGGGNKADFNPDDSPSSKLVHIKVWNCYNTIENIYGGGNAAAVTGTNVFVEGGRYNYIFAGGNGQITAANVLGDAEMTIHSGRVGWYFEGCNMQGSVSGTVTVHAGHQETEPEWPCGELKVENYYFGANMATVYDGKVSLVECGGESQFDYRNVYAGSRLATIYGDIELTVRGGTIGNLYGGSEGSDFISADVKRYPVDAADIANFPAEHQAGLTAYLTAHPEKYGKGGNIILRLEGGKIENVFGGCNYRGNVEGNIYIIVDSIAGSCPLDINYLYGGSKLASYTPRDTTGVNHYSPKIELKNGHVNYDVFGGSRGGDSTHPWGNGIMTANPQVIVGHKTTGTFRIGRDLYGGGSAGDVNGDTEIKIDGHLDGSSNPTTNIIGNVFGGGRSGDVNGNSKVTIVE